MADLEINKRLKKIIEEYYKISPVEFAKKYKDTKAVKTYNILSERNGLSNKMLETILLAYPEINKTWLLTGDGEMLKTKERDGVITISQNDLNCKKGTPVYDIDVTCGFDSRSLRDEEIVGYVDLPYISKDGRHIVSATGESMTPIVKDGDKIVLKELMSWDLLYYGQIYIVVTEDFRMMKYIHKHPTDSTKVVLKSENKHYDDIELPKKLILKLFIVENILSIKNMV